MRLIFRPTGLLLALALTTACNDEHCKYHEGVDSLTLTANPASISALNGTSLVTAIGTGQDNLPMPDGTAVTFVANIGSFSQAGQALTSGGIARITYVSPGTNGTAHIYARSGRTVSPTVDVLIGTNAVGTIRLTANPGTLPGEGGNSKLTATVFSKDGVPIAGIPVVFNSDNGTLASGSSPRTSDSNGQSTDTLKVRRNTTGDILEITLTAQVGEVSGTTTIQQLKPK